LGARGLLKKRVRDIGTADHGKYIRDAQHRRHQEPTGCEVPAQGEAPQMAGLQQKELYHQETLPATGVAGAWTPITLSPSSNKTSVGW
jgi:hypothetical protein